VKRREPPDDLPTPYAVGYGKPPVATRFQKGKSGNPNGRPRRVPLTSSGISDDSFAGLFLRIIEQPVTIREGDQTREISMSEAVSKAIFKSALGGNNRAQRQVVELHDSAVAAKSASIAKRNEVARLYIEVCREETADCARRKVPPPRHVPHPDDIVIIDGEPPRFKGPGTEEEADRLDMAHRMANALLLHSFWEEERMPVNPATGRQPPSIAGIHFEVLNAKLPARMRTSTEEMLIRWGQFDRLRAREKRAAIIRAWQEVVPGIRPSFKVSPRGAGVLAALGADLEKLSAGLKHTDLSTTS
jgi:hypothetical protein